MTAYVFLAKRKDGVYRPKQFAISSPGGLQKKWQAYFIEEVQKKIKQGRYHDWFFGKSPYEYKT